MQVSLCVYTIPYRWKKHSNGTYNADEFNCTYNVENEIEYHLNNDKNFQKWKKRITVSIFTHCFMNYLSLVTYSFKNIIWNIYTLVTLNTI